MSALKPAALLTLAALCAAAAAPSLARAPDPVPAAAAPVQDYRIGAYDVIEIEVFEINDLHREVQVDGSGRILMPLIGAVQAQGRTTDQLSDDLRQRLEARYIKSARVSVQVKQAQSERVTVDGAVAAPGVYPLGGRTTLMQAVAMARGPDGANANMHKVSLFHAVASQWTRTEYDLTKIRSGQVDDPVVEGRDVIIVAGSHRQQILHDLGTILPSILLLAAL
jgi:polysaccharide export outer membrane protein